MKRVLPLLLFLAQAAPAALAPEWIVETPLEFITTGRFQSPSDGTDLLVVDKASGLARLGLRVGGDLTWSDQPTGMAALTGFTTLRHGSQDQIAASSAAWNAVQLATPGGPPQTLTSPVVGPHGLIRLSTGHAAGAVVDDILTLSNLGDSPDPLQIAALSAAGTSLFITPAAPLPEAAQCLPLPPLTGLPVLISNRGNTLRVDRLDRAGFVPGGFAVTGPHAAGLYWAAAETELFSIAKDSLSLRQHRLASAPAAAGFTVASGVASTTPHALPELVAGLDTVPFADPAYPTLRCLVGVRFASAPGTVHLYRLLDTPTPSAVELLVLNPPPGESFAGFLPLGADFLLLSGPEGRVASWGRYAQPAPGQLPVLVATGTLPALRPRAANPNIFIFNQDPFTTEQAVLTGSQSRLSWTTITGSVSQAETDRGTASGLGDAQPLAVSAPGGVAIGNQPLASVSLTSFGAAGTLPRSGVTFAPRPGTYAALTSGRTFPLALSATPSSEGIRYRLPGGAVWATYSEATRPALSAGGTVSAFALDAATGARSPLVTATYAFGALPPVVPAIVTDTNGNGLSNAWERAFGITDPNSDADGDGFNALTEHNYGSDPLDSGSHPTSGGGGGPVATLAITLQAGNLVLDWPDGLVGYFLESSPDLIVWTVIAPQPTGSTWSEPVPVGRKFYRLRKP